MKTCSPVLLEDFFVFGNASRHARFPRGMGDGFGDGGDHVFIKDAGKVLST
ncbi:MAG: hypothetical protein ACYTGS_06700 [Planctomycetota bacterium]|jgi:hypothetical protein